MTSLSLLFVIPVLALTSSLYMYRFHGRRQMLKFDLIQFIYSFVLSPVLFVTIKSIVFVLIKNELNIRLSINQIFLFDTLFSVIFLYIYGFIVIHSLTTSFKLVMLKDPLADLFEYSEYFHLWLSHVVMWIGGGLMLIIMGVLNIFFPLLLNPNRNLFFSSLWVGVLLGIVVFAATLNSDPQQRSYMRLMKLMFGFLFIINTICYFIFEPAMNMQYLLFWTSFLITMTLVACSLFVHRSDRAIRFFDRFKYKHGWDFRLQLFDKPTQKK
jgi:hypothetical protein